MNITPEMIEALGKVVIGIIVAISGLLTPIIGYYTWKTRYEVDKLYAKTYRPKENGSPGEMRKHPAVLVRMFTKRQAPGEPKTITQESAATGSINLGAA